MLKFAVLNYTERLNLLREKITTLWGSATQLVFGRHYAAPYYTTLFIQTMCSALEVNSNLVWPMTNFPSVVRRQEAISVSPVLYNMIVIRFLQMPGAFVRKITRGFFTEKQLDAALNAVKSGRPVREVGLAFRIAESAVRLQLKIGCS